MADTLRDLVIRLGFDVNTSAIPQVDAQLRKATTQAGMLDKAMGSAFARFAGPAALAGTAFKGIGIVKDTLTEAGDAAIEFGRSMASIQTLLPNDQGRVVELRGQIQELAKATGRSSGEIASAVNDVLQSFEDSADTMRLAEIATRGATASGTDAKTAFDLLSTSMLQYGKSGAFAAKETMDMAFAMRQFGKIEVSQMAHGVGLVAGNMHELGASEKEMFALLGAASGITGPVEESFTQLSSIITALETPTKELKKLYKELGIESIKAAVQKDGLFGVMQKVYAGTGGSIEKLALLIPDVRARRMFGPLVTEQAERYAKAVGLVASSSGKAAEADKAFRGGLNKTGNDLDVLDARFRTVSENMGTRLAPMQLAFKQFSVDAIEALAAVETAMEKLVAGKNEKPGEVSAMGMGQTVVQGLGFLGNVVGGVATDILPQALGGGAGFTSGADRTIQEARQLVDRLNGGNGLAQGAGAQRRGSGDAPVALNAGGKAFRDVSTQINQTNTINLTLPEGADAQQFADAFDRAARKNADALARNVQSAASGDSP